MAAYTGDEQASITRLGLYNTGFYDQSSNAYGFSGVGYKTNFPLMGNDVAKAATAVKKQADAAATSATAAAAVVASRPKATSTSTIAIGTSGTRAFTTAQNLLTAQPFYVGDNVKSYVTTDPAKYVTGVVTAVAASSLTMTLADGVGSGTFSGWTIIAQGDRGAATGIANVQADASPTLGGDLTTGAHAISVSTGGGISMAAASNGLAMNGAPIEGARMVDYDEAVASLGSVLNTVALATSSVIHRYCALGGNTVFAVSGTPSPGGKIAIVLEIIQPSSDVNTSGAPYTLAFTGVVWAGAAPATPAYGKRLKVTLERRDGDTTWVGQINWTNVPA